MGYDYVPPSLPAEPHGYDEDVDFAANDSDSEDAELTAIIQHDLDVLRGQGYEVIHGVVIIMDDDFEDDDFEDDDGFSEAYAVHVNFADMEDDDIDDASDDPTYVGTTIWKGASGREWKVDLHTQDSDEIPF